MIRKKLTVFYFSSIVAGLFITAAQALESPAPKPSVAPAMPTVPSDLVYKVSSDYSGNAAVLGGSVIPHKMVKLLAQWKGEVKFIAGEEGDEFKAGARLVALDDDILQAKRASAIAGLRSAEAGLRNAQVQYERERRSPNSQSNSMLGGAPSMFSMFSDPMREMTGQGSPGYERHSSMYGMGVQIQTARDQIEQARAGLAELDKNIANASVVAPFDGVIIKKMAEVGDTINPGMPLIVFADTTRMQIQVEVPSRLISTLKKGETALARLEGNDTPVEVNIARIFPMANMGGHTTTVKLDIPRDVESHAGMYAEVIVPDRNSSAEKIAVIPESAITWRGSLPAVFQISKDNTRLRMRTIRLGDHKDNGKVAVLSGLSIGDRILKQPSSRTRSGPYLPDSTH